MMTLEEKINAFWDWFVNNESKIIRAIEDEILAESIVESLDQLILDMGAFSWEIGPGIDAPWFLTISPNENLDLLSISRQIMIDAPDLQHWEFNDSKPRINWDRKFTIYDELMDEQHIDASSWCFVTFDGDYGKIDVLLEANNIQHLDQETARTAASLVVMSELGEETKIKRIGSIELMQELEVEDAQNKSSIAALNDHILSM